MIPQLGPLEIIVVVLVALLVFGPKRLPEVGRQVGRGLREVKKLQEQVSQELHQVLHSDDPEDPFSGLTDFVSRAGGRDEKKISDAVILSHTDTDPQIPASGPLTETVTNSEIRSSTNNDETNLRNAIPNPTIGQAPSKYRPPAAT